MVVGQRGQGKHFNLSSPVQIKSAVEPASEYDPFECLHPVQYRCGVLLVTAVHDDLVGQYLTAYVEATHGDDVGSGLPDGGGQTAKRVGDI